MPDSPTPERMLEEIFEVSDIICNEWEIDFLSSIEGQVSSGKLDLTEKQAAVLKRIYQKACASPY